MDQQTVDKIDYVYKLLFITALVITGLILAKSVTVPLALSSLIAFALMPVTRRLERFGLGRILSIIITFLISMGILYLLGSLVSGQLADLAKNLPNLEDRFNALLVQTQQYIADRFGIDTGQQNEYVRNSVQNAGTYVRSVLLSTTNVLAVLLQIPVYVFLLLLYRTNFKEFLLSYFPVKNEHSKKSWIEQIKTVIQGYVSGLLLVILIIAVLNCIGLLLLGIPYAIFFGVFAAFMTILPYIGNFIGASLPVIMALITKDSSWYALGVIGVFVVVQFLEANVITPNIMGSKVSINALAAILGLLLGGMILGIAGMIIAIPTMGIIKVILANSEYLKPFTLLISETTGSNKPEKTKPEDIQG